MNFRPAKLDNVEILNAFPEHTRRLVPVKIRELEAERKFVLSEVRETAKRCSEYDPDTRTVCLEIWKYFSGRSLDEIDRRLFSLRGLQMLISGKVNPNVMTDEMIERARTFPIETMSGLELRRAGRLFKGRCPFHADGQERTPSFTVYADGGGFYCFGCGAGGDSIKFLQLKQGLSFPEAVRFLAGGTQA